MTGGLFSFAYGLKCLGLVKFCNILVNSKSELFSNQAIYTLMGFKHFVSFRSTLTARS